MWATVQNKNYGYLVLFGRTRDGENHGHFEIHVPGNNLGPKYSRGFIKEIRSENKVLFSDSKARKTRSISAKINDGGTITSFNFVEK